MANPAAHEVQNLSSRREVLPVELRDGGDRAFVYVGDKPRRPIKFLVRCLVGTFESLFRNLWQILASFWPLMRNSHDGLGSVRLPGLARLLPPPAFDKTVIFAQAGFHRTRRSTPPTGSDL